MQGWHTKDVRPCVSRKHDAFARRRCVAVAWAAAPHLILLHAIHLVHGLLHVLVLLLRHVLLHVLLRLHVLLLLLHVRIYHVRSTSPPFKVSRLWMLHWMLHDRMRCLRPPLALHIRCCCVWRW